MKNEPLLLWEILVPCSYNTGKPVRTRHHKEWDKYVRKVSGGLTIFKPAKGQWIAPGTDDLYDERVIPVRIACTATQIKKIMKFTIRHYKQLAVMAYVISDCVIIMNDEDDDKERKNQITFDLY